MEYDFVIDNPVILTIEVGESQPVHEQITNNINFVKSSDLKIILNNLINDLKTTSIGGYVNQRVADKDSYYASYKDAKLKYLALKKNIN